MILYCGTESLTSNLIGNVLTKMHRTIKILYCLIEQYEGNYA